MQSRKSRRVPVNVIAGGLGVGKTTAINHLLRQRPEHEDWAILINEYGEIGVDAALVASTSPGAGVEVREVAGGCICCSAGVMFEMSLVLMLGRRPDRLLIEPTGLATLTGTLRTLQAPGLREAVELRSIIALVDPARWGASRWGAEDEDRVAAADIVLANRCDRATGEQVEVCLDALRALRPAKTLVARVDHAAIDLALLDLAEPARPGELPRGQRAFRATAHAFGAAGYARGPGATRAPGLLGPAVSLQGGGNAAEERMAPEATEPGAMERRANRTAHASTLGWVIHGDEVFDADRLASWVQRVGASDGTLRLKAVVHTNAGWWMYNVVEGTTEARPAAWSRSSRVELVCAPEASPDATSVEAALRRCLEEPIEEGEGACPSTAT